MDMDKFMEEFLDGKFLDEEPERRGSGVDSRKVGVRRTKSGDDIRKMKKCLDKRGERPLQRSKSGDGSTGMDLKAMRRSLSKDKNQLDPQTILRVLEHSAETGNENMADAILQHGMKRRSSRSPLRNSRSSTSSKRGSSTSPKRGSKSSPRSSATSVLDCEDLLQNLSIAQSA